ncbi:MAG: hypothetical protein ABI794_10540 [Betaproteobacteria bacterium]
MDAYLAGDRACPNCNGRAYRIRRRFIDRLTSLVTPIQRYRCDSVTCGWEGNLPVHPKSDHSV